MARRRMIDPMFWASEHNMHLCFRQRLLFIGLISNSDDEGRLKGNVNFIRAVVFPYDDFSGEVIAEDLELLVKEEMIIWYTIEDEKGREAQYIQISNWYKYQRVDKPRPSIYPPPETGWNDSDNDSENDSQNDYTLKRNEKNGNEEKLKEKKRNVRKEPFSDQSVSGKRPDSVEFIHLSQDHPFLAQIPKLGNDPKNTIEVNRIMRLIEKFGIKKIRWGYSLCLEAIEQGRCNNPPAFFESAVQRDFKMHPGSRAAEIYKGLQ